MKYELIQERNKQLSLLLQVLTNRGIKNVEGYLHTDDSYILDPLKLDNMSGGVRMFLDNQKKKSKVFLLVDSDTDGYTSAAVIYNYAYRMWPDWVESNWTYYLHETKTHGLKDCIDKILEEDYDFILIPDAGSNDYEEIETLYFKNKDVLILDHHEAEKTTNKAVVINNQLCSYPTKSLTGAGIVYKFCQRLDSVLNVEIADCFLDLVVAGLIADVADLRDLETHRIVEKGLLHIYSPLLQTIVDKNDYTLKGKLNPKGISFSVAPIINSITRIGTLDEKEMLFKSMLERFACTLIPSEKRGHKGEPVQLVEEAYRIASNVRNRQNKIRDGKLAELLELIETNNLADNKILVVQDPVSNGDEKGITGLVANQLMSKYKKPVLLLHATEKDGEIIWEGSARNAPNTELHNLKDFVSNSNLVEMAQGHQSAFGVAIKDNKINDFINYSNEALKDIDFSTSFLVDDIINYSDVDDKDIISIYHARDIWAQGIEEPTIAILNIPVSSSNVYSNDKLIKIETNRVDYIKFKPTLDEMDLFNGINKRKTINVVGVCSYNEFDKRAQILILDYEFNTDSFWDF